MVSWKTCEIMLFIHPCLMFAFSQWHYIDLPSALLDIYCLPILLRAVTFLSQSHSVGCHYENVMLDISSCSVCLLFPTAFPVCLFWILFAIQYTYSFLCLLMCRFNTVVYSIVQIISESTEWSWKWCGYPWNIHLNASFLFDRELWIITL